MFRSFLTFLLIPFFITASEFRPIQQSLDIDKGIDSFIVIDPFNPIEKTKIGFNSFLNTPCGLSYLVISPRMDIYLNGNFDTSLGIGIRRPFKTFILGSHIFADYSFQRPIPFYQLGNSWELITNEFDFRINYYHPIKNKNILNQFICVPQKWLEADCVWKFEDFCVGFGPIYNFTSEKWAFKPKIVIPFLSFNIEIGVYLSDKFSEHTSYFSLGIPLYSLGQKPVVRSCSVKVAPYGTEILPVKKKIF